MSFILNPAIFTDTVSSNGALYFLEGGHFLFRYQEKGGWQSKFVTTDDVAASLAGVPNDSGWLGKGILRAGRSERGDWFVYSAPAQKITIQLAAGEPKEITVPAPATVLIGVKNSYYLFATKDDQVGPNSSIYAAPFPNIYGFGRICWGSNHPPAAHHKNAGGVWSMFFGSPFNTHLANGKSKAYVGNVTEKLCALSTSHARKYDLNDLVPVGENLNNLVDRIMNRDWRD